ELMRRRYGIDGVRISLDKRIPFGAGLGGGSADATAVIRAIDTLFSLLLSEQELIDAAAELGSDTAFFVRNTPQYCTGRGEIMTPVDLPLDGWWLAVVKPDEGVSTREAYAGVVPHEPERDLCRDLTLPVEHWQGIVGNDFEPHIFASHPRIADLKRRLADSGAAYVSMSGSGSALFGLFAEPPVMTLPAGTFVHTERIGDPESFTECL
ncbi:MAG: 4-(cytidine 5'-diphospho)-2-C-methyl-D-erythritol kinase, partial [Alistipes sp.]|nr:4-(cytidine 5'-diphospho)-2-C-methyl-D-erythritol kinase [Alistipes sp.]